MRTRRAKSRTTPHLANVIESLESRCLLSGAADLVGDTPVTATNLGILTTTRPLEVLGTIDEAFDRDVFQFQSATQGTILIELSAQLSSLDSFVTLFDSSGNLIASDDDSGPELNSRLSFTIERGVSFFVEARGFSTSIGDFFLRITSDAGFSPESATNLGNLTATRPLMAMGSIAASETHDLFLFTAQINGTVAVQQVAAPVVGNALPFDGVLQAFNVGSSFPLATDFGSADTTIPRVVTFSVVAGQRYFAEVTGFGGSTGDYQLTVNYVVDDVPAAGVDFEFPSRAGLIEVSGDIDTYRFTANADQTLQISLDAAAGSVLDPILDVRVFSGDDLTTPLRTFRNDDFGSSLNSFLSVPGVLQGQVIEVDASGFGSSRGGYNLTIVAVNGNGVVTDLVANSPAFGSIETAFSTDVFRFIAESLGVATIDVTSFDSPALPLGAIGDPLVTIRETVTGNFVAFDNDSGPRLNSRATFFVMAGTQYDVVVGGFGIRTGNYRVTLSTNVGDDGDTFDQATALSFVNNSLTKNRDGSISPPSMNRPSDVDVFSFMADSNGTLRVSATPSGTSLQAGLSVFQASPTGNSADVELLAVSGASGPGTSTELFVPVSQGRTYFFRVSGLNGSVGNYSLLVEDQNDPVPGEAPGTVLDLDRNTGTGTPTNQSDQSINFRSDRDWYRVIAPAIGEFTINLDQAPGSTLDPFLTIYNDQGLAIVRNDDTVIGNGVLSLNSRLTLQASRANEVFFVESAGINETTGDYRLTVQFTAQAADDFGNDVGHSSLIPEGSPGRFAQQGLLEATQDRDVFAFTAVVGASFTLELATLNGGALPAGVDVQVFEVEASSLSAVSLDNLTRVASITTVGGELALNLPGDDSAIAIQQSPDDLQPTERHFLVAVSNVGMATNIGYNFSINVNPGVASQDLQLQNAALFALLSLADGAAAMGDQDPVAINAAIQAAVNELGESGSFLVVLLDSVNDPVLTDSAGRQTGFMSNIGTLNGIPGGYASVGSFSQVLILPINPSQPGSVSLQFAGVGSLGQALSSFSAVVVVPSGSAPVSLTSPTTNNDGGKGDFIVALGFEAPPPPPPPPPPAPPDVIPPRSTVSDDLFRLFFAVSRGSANDATPTFLGLFRRTLAGRRTPSTSETVPSIEDTILVQPDDVLQQSIGRNLNDSKVGIGLLVEIRFVELANLFDTVLDNLQFEGLSQQSFARIVERLRGSDSKVPMELMKNASVVRSVNAMYGVMSLGANWLGAAKRKQPVQKPRSPIPKVSQESPEPKRGLQAGGRSTKSRQMGG